VKSATLLALMAVIGLLVLKIINYLALENREYFGFTSQEKFMILFSVFNAIRVVLYALLAFFFFTVYKKQK
jgi:hypothetical protein